MKASLFFCVWLAMASAFAQSSGADLSSLSPAEGQSRLQNDMVTPRKPWYEDRAAIGLIYATSGSMKGASASQSGQSLGSSETEVQSGWAVTGQYKETLAPQWNLTQSLSVFEARDMNQSNVAHVGSFSSGATPSFQPWVLAANAQYDLTDFLYFPVGLNYTIYDSVHEGNLNAFSMTPEIGFQMGVGFWVSHGVDVELTYQSLRYDMSMRAGDRSASGTVALDGLDLALRYTF